MKKKQLNIAGIILILSAFIFPGLDCRTSDNKVLPEKIISQADENRIDSIVSVLTLEEKVNMLCRNSFFTSPGIARFGIDDLHYTDGPFGIREEVGKNSWIPQGLTTDSATFFPTGSALAATWNPDLAYQYGIAIGEEAKTRGKNILLGPAVNITRTPLNGRTYEYLSEDPFLNSRLAVGYIKGVQKNHVAACVKHYLANNQETNRDAVDVYMDERTLREIYLPAFKAAVTEGGAYSVMTAYNKFRGSYCAENKYILNTILDGEMNFKGMVISDWGGTHSTVKSALSGLDVEMGSDKFFNKSLLDSVKIGLVPESVINDMVKRILRVYFLTHAAQEPVNKQVSTPDHMKTAYDVACQSIVLLKNTNKILPLAENQIKNLLVIGDNAIRTQAQGGYGTGVKARYEITPLKGLQNRLGKSVNIKFVQGYSPSYSGIPNYNRHPDKKSNQDLLKEAVNDARQADAVILFVGDNRVVETESIDRKSLSLPFGQDELIKAICKANPGTVLVVITGAPVDMKVAESSASAILWSGFNGSEAGDAIADVILGKINPSGKLPFTFPARIEDSPAHALKAYPGNETENYKEGILVGYRWFDTKNIEPLYCFGYGLSYTDFAYSNMQPDKKAYAAGDTIKISLDLNNTGNRDGMETVQLYATDLKPKELKAAKELKGFQKVMVPAGSGVKVILKIAANDLSWYDDKQMKWVLDAGNYQFSAGSSSRDIRTKVQVEIKNK